MSNILTEKLPTNLIVSGETCSINSDFRIGIQFEELLNNKILSDEDIWTQALVLYYPIVPQDINEAIQQMMWFYRCGKDLKQSEEDEERPRENIYSFEHDAESIYSAFLDQYRVDLQEVEYLHWWKFKALFSAFKEDTDISKKMSIRATDINKMPLEQREYYKKLKKIYEIPHDEDEEGIDELDLALMNGGDLTGIL